MIVEWIISLFMDVLLLVGEVGLNLWLGLVLRDQSLTNYYHGILALIFVPLVLNAAVWLNLRQSYRKISNLVMLVALIIGFPSPVLV